MRKIVTTPLIAGALVASVAGTSGLPSTVNAQGGNRYDYNMHHNNNDQWRSNDYRWNNGNGYGNTNWRNDYRWDNNHHRWDISDREAIRIAQRYFPGRRIMSRENRWDHNGRHEHRFRFDDNHCIDIRDDGVVIRIFVIYPR